jgi:hypothetical protein
MSYPGTVKLFNFRDDSPRCQFAAQLSSEPVFFQFMRQLSDHSHSFALDTSLPV